MKKIIHLLISFLNLAFRFYSCILLADTNRASLFHATNKLKAIHFTHFLLLRTWRWQYGCEHRLPVSSL